VTGDDAAAILLVGLVLLDVMMPCLDGIEVLAGIVGRQRFSFDIWGDTVNVAARLAAHGELPSVHLSRAADRGLVSRPDPHQGKGRDGSLASGELGVMLRR
jgi:CheY-like chemotaxis protein